LQEQAHNADREPTFEAVLEVTMTGLIAAARQHPSPHAIALLDIHLPAHDRDTADRPR
jgi:hypothetical protein